MSGYQTIGLTREGGVATVRLDRESVRNTLNGDMMAELTHVARTLRTDADLRAVILLGADTFFSAGADATMVMEAVNAVDSETPDLMALRDRLRAGPDMCAAWAAIEAPTVAAIEGYCVGGAVSLVLACDFRILSEGATMALPEVKLGMNMSWHTLPRLAALAGPSRAKRMALFGDPVPAETLLDWGVADALSSDGNAAAEAADWARRLAALPPLPVRMTVEAVDAAVAGGDVAARFADRDQFLLTLLGGSIRRPGGKDAS